MQNIFLKNEEERLVIQHAIRCALKLCLLFITSNVRDTVLSHCHANLPIFFQCAKYVCTNFFFSR